MKSNSSYTHLNANHLSSLSGRFFWTTKKIHLPLRIHPKSCLNLRFHYIFISDFYFIISVNKPRTETHCGAYCTDIGHRKGLPWWACMQNKKLAMHVNSTHALTHQRRDNHKTDKFYKAVRREHAKLILQNICDLMYFQNSRNIFHCICQKMFLWLYVGLEYK